MFWISQFQPHRGDFRGRSGGFAAKLPCCLLTRLKIPDRPTASLDRASIRCEWKFLRLEWHLDRHDGLEIGWNDAEKFRHSAKKIQGGHFRTIRVRAGFGPIRCVVE